MLPEYDILTATSVFRQGLKYTEIDGIAGGPRHTLSTEEGQAPSPYSTYSVPVVSIFTTLAVFVDKILRL